MRVKMKINNLIIILILVLLGTEAVAKDICEEQKLGWHFYCNKAEPENEKEAEDNGTTESAKEKLEQIKAELEELKAKAVIYPTEANIKNYITYQKAVLDRAEVFSNKWQKVVWQNPEVDYMVKKPASVVGNELVNEMKIADQNEILANLSERYGLFFFYKTSCSYCHKFSPILKVYSDINKVTVMPISMDEGILPEWPETTFNKGEAAKFGLMDKPVPALILFDSKEKRVIPVGFGLLTMDELTKRIVELVKQNEKGHD